VSGRATFAPFTLIAVLLLPHTWKYFVVLQLKSGLIQHIKGILVLCSSRRKFLRNLAKSERFCVSFGSQI